MAQHSLTGLAPLGAGFSETLITPGGPDFDAARSLWNGDIDRRPRPDRCHRPLATTVVTAAKLP
jgi:hypothetical protein